MRGGLFARIRESGGGRRPSSSVVRNAACCGGLIAVLLVVAAALPAREDPGSSKRWSKPKFHLDASFSLGHTSNLYHVREDRKDDFDTETERFERFFEMKGPSDLFSTIELDLSWTWKDDAGRKMRISFDTTTLTFRDNRIADYTELGIGSRFDLTSADRIKVRLEAVPHRFRKNYSEELFPMVEVFTHAYSDEWGFAVEYDRSWTKRWETALELEWGERSYNRSHRNRDREMWGWSLESELDLSKAFRLLTAVSQGWTRTQDGLESGIRTDRSHDDDRAELGIEVSLPADWTLEATGELRVRDYTTDTVEDVARYHRTDRRRRYSLLGEKVLGRRWILILDADWLRNRTNRSEARLDDEESGYREFQGGAGLRFEF